MAFLKLGLGPFGIGGVRARDRDDMPNCTGGRSRHGTESAEPGSHEGRASGMALLLGEGTCTEQERTGLTGCCLKCLSGGVLGRAWSGATGTGLGPAGEWLMAKCLARGVKLNRGAWPGRRQSLDSGPDEASTTINVISAVGWFSGPSQPASADSAGKTTSQNQNLDPRERSRWPLYFVAITLIPTRRVCWEEQPWRRRIPPQLQLPAPRSSSGQKRSSRDRGRRNGHDRSDANY